MNSNSKGAEYYYIVKPNENASSLLYQMNLKPIYHEWGTLKALQKVNARRIINLGHLKTGDKLFFPESLVLNAKNQGLIKLTDQNEIIFNDSLKLFASPTRDVASQSANQTDIPLVNPSTEILPVPEDETEKFKLSSANQATNTSQSNLVFDFGTGYSRIDSSLQSANANAVLLSKPLFSAHFKWEQFWSDSTQSFIRWGLESIPYQDASRGSINGEKQNISLMGFGLNQRLFFGIFASIEAGEREEIFVTSYLSGSASLETRPINYYRLVFSKKLAAVNNLSLTGSLGVDYLSGTSGSNYKVHSGQDYFGQLQVTQKFKNFSFFGQGEYINSNQKTSLTTQTRKDIKTQLGFIFPLEEETP